MAVVEYVNMSNIQFIICYLHYFFIQVFSDPSCSTPADTVLTTNAKRLDYYFKCNETLTQRHYVSGLNGVASSISFGVYGMFFFIFTIIFNLIIISFFRTYCIGISVARKCDLPKYWQCNYCHFRRLQRYKKNHFPLV